MILNKTHPHMKKILYLLIALMGLGIWSCKPSEKNYRAAYERTMARDSTRTDFNETVYGRYRREIKEVPAFNENDTVNVKTTRVWVVKNEGALNEQLKKYCVIIAEFKQLLNARSIRDRFKEGGYPGAFIVQTPEPYYYVVAAAYTDLSEAVTLTDKLRRDTPVRMKAPCPYILMPSTL